MHTTAKSVKSVLALACMTLSFAAVAQTAAAPASTLSFNVGAVSDYRFRGVSQTSFKPALQAGVDFGHTSGVYIGAWTSNIKWIQDYIGATDGVLEVDLYAGFKKEIAKDLSMDIGFITYQYPGNTTDKVLVNANTNEVYAALTWGILTAKYSHSTSNFIANPESKNSRYFELAANIDLGNGLSLTPHVGRQYIPNQADNAGDYTDYALTLGKDFGNGVSASLAAFHTSAKDSFYKANGIDNLGKNGVALGVKYSF